MFSVSSLMLHLTVNESHRKQCVKVYSEMPLSPFTSSANGLNPFERIILFKIASGRRTSSKDSQFSALFISHSKSIYICTKSGSKEQILIISGVWSFEPDLIIQLYPQSIKSGSKDPILFINAIWSFEPDEIH